MSLPALPSDWQPADPCPETHHEVFVQEYVRTRSVRIAAKLAGMAPNSVTIATLGRRLPHVAARVRYLMGQQLQGLDLTAEDVLLEIKRVAMQDVRDLYDDQGRMLSPQELSDDAAATVTAIDEEVRWEPQEDGPLIKTVTRKVRRADKNAALALLAKHFRLVGDESDGVNALAAALADRLKEARRRAQVEDAEDATLVEAPPSPPGVLRAPRDLHDVVDVQASTIPATQPTAESSDERLW